MRALQMNSTTLLFYNRQQIMGKIAINIASVLVLISISYLSQAQSSKLDLELVSQSQLYIQISYCNHDPLLKNDENQNFSVLPAKSNESCYYAGKYNGQVEINQTFKGPNCSTLSKYFAVQYYLDGKWIDAMLPTNFYNEKKRFKFNKYKRKTVITFVIDFSKNLSYKKIIKARLKFEYEKDNFMYSSPFDLKVSESYITYLSTLNDQ